MANPQHVDLLRQGVGPWNSYRYGRSDFVPDLRGADLRGLDLLGVDMREADLTAANLSGIMLNRACFTKATLTGADLSESAVNYAYLFSADLESAKMTRISARDSNFRGSSLKGASLADASFVSADLAQVDFQGARLERTNFTFANLTKANFSQAQLQGAVLDSAILVGTDLTGADLTGASVHGISAWDLILDRTTQSALIITPKGQPLISIDNIEVAQFVYLLLNSPKIRDVIDTIAKKAVLILGRFTAERKPTLDAIRDALRGLDYLPVLFDFECPSQRDITETVAILAHMARFVIVDLTDPRSVPQELMAMIPNLPSVPIQPIIESAQQPYGMFEHFTRYPWVLEAYRYDDTASLISEFEKHVIAPAEEYLV